MGGWKGGGDCGNREMLYIPVTFGFDRMAQETILRVHFANRFHDRECL